MAQPVLVFFFTLTVGGPGSPDGPDGSISFPELESTIQALFGGLVWVCLSQDSLHSPV